MDPRIDDQYDQFDERNFAHAGDRENPDAQAFDAELFLSGERIGPPLRRSRSTMLSASIAIIVMLAIGWGAAATRDIWLVWWQALIAPSPPVLAARPETPQPPPAIQPEREIATAPGRDAGTPVVPKAENQPEPKDAALETPPSASEASTEQTDDEEDKLAAREAEPLAIKAPSDPLKKRAFSAGLHPELSPALLSRMTSVDFRNAATAVKKALAELADADVLVWPKKAPAKGAQFEVRFVQSAAPGCRRYVVTVIKDRWSTTAQPMEKCGAELPSRKRANG